MVWEKERRPTELLAMGLAVTHDATSRDPWLARPTATSPAGLPSPAPTIIFSGVKVIKSSRVNLTVLGFKFNLRTIFVALKMNFGIKNGICGFSGGFSSGRISLFFLFYLKKSSEVGGGVWQVILIWLLDGYVLYSVLILFYGGAIGEVATF
jgi:ABC-type multidrug transport system permease subunit